MEGGFDKQGKSHTKQLVVFGVAAVIVALAAAVVFQSLVPQQQAKLEGFSEKYCLSLLEKHYPDVADVSFASASPGNPYNSKTSSLLDAPIEITVYGTQDNRVAGCKAEASMKTSAPVEFEDEYDCSGITVRYKAEENSRYLSIFVENELAEEISTDDFVAIDSKNLLRFIQTAEYFNPTEFNTWEDLLAKLRRNEC
ncbi:MAG: hypothetical protein HYW25_05020 [Candidatus Aenigmarchaeota archaeon]|nr:hypothetical protein [Candidatus Aenigmarchaeota archaeon]